MKIKFTLPKGFDSLGQYDPRLEAFEAGKQVDVDDAFGSRWVERKLAVEVKDKPAAKKPAAKKDD